MTLLAASLTVADALIRLAAARGGMLDDVTSEVYLVRLQREDPELVSRACERWQDIPRREYETALPDLGKLLETVAQIAAEDVRQTALSRLLPMPKSERDEPTFVCHACRDEPSAWLVLWCRGEGSQRVGIEGKTERYVGLTSSPCGRPQSHGPHSYTERCSCSDTNPVIAKHRERIATFHAQRAR